MKTRAATSDGFLCRGLGESLKPSVRWGRGDVEWPCFMKKEMKVQTSRVVRLRKS